MPPRRIPKGAMKQERVFYTKEWTQEVDHKFITALVAQTSTGNFLVSHTKRHAIMAAMAEVNRQFGTNFDYAFCVDRAKKLRKRYKVFNWIVHLPGVMHNPFSNDIECDEGLWDFICREQILGRAYMIQGETEFDALKFIFHEGPTNFECWGEVVEAMEISGGQEKTRSNEGMIVLEEERDANIDEEEDTDNSFGNEMAWCASDTNSEASIPDIKIVMQKLENDVVLTTRAPSTEPASSVASDFPLRKC